MAPTARTIQPRFRGAAASLLLLVLLALAFHWPLVVSAPGQIIDTPDITKYFVWLHQYSRDTIASGHFPLWNPYNFAGTPFAANPSLTVFYPPTWISLLLPVVEMHRLLIVVHSLLAGLFLHLYLRKLGLGLGAVTFACLPWMFGSYFMAHAVVGHLPRIFTMAWLPLVLYLFECSFDGDRLRFLFWTGFALGVQVLAGEPQNSLYTAVLLAGYGLLRSAGEGRPSLDRTLAWTAVRWGGRMAIIVAVAALTSAVQLLPTVELLGESERSANTFEFVTTLSYPPRSLVGFLIPWSTTMPWIVDARTGRALAILNWEFAGYVGILTLVMAGLSFAVPGRAALRSARVFLFVGFILMLGRYTPMYGLLLRWLPGLSAFRIPARAIVLVQWSLAVMSAFGFEWLFARERWRAGRWRTWACLAVLALATCLIVPLLWFDLSRPVADLYLRVSAVEALRLTSPTMLRALSCMLATLVVVVAVRWMPRRVAMTLVLAVSVADLLVARPTVPLAPFDPSADPSARLFRALREEGSAGTTPFRVDVAPSHADAEAAVGQMENVNAYWPLSIGRFHRYAYAMRGLEPHPNLHHQLHDYLYAGGNPFPLRLLNVQFASKVDVAGQTIALMRDPDFLPRAWIVDKAVVVAGETEALRAVQDPSFDARQAAILERPTRITLAGAGTSPGSVTSVKRRPEGGLDVTTQTSREGYLLLSEVRYPGWRATVDGRQVPLERADYLITALPLPPGGHQVTYRYHPLSFRIGAWGTFSSLMIASAIVGGGFVKARRRRRPAGSPRSPAKP